MKRIFITFFAAAALAFSFNAHAFDLKGALKNLGNGSTDSQTEQSGSQLGNLLNAVNSLVGGSNTEYKDLVGTWKYCSPAVSFQTDNMLQKAGGAAASTMINQKIAPYYQKAGITSLEMTFGTDSTFVAKAKGMTAKGTVSIDDKGQYIFSFSSLGVVPSGKIKAFVEKSGPNVLITFDASKLMEIAEKIASLSKNATLQSATTLINSYDGVNIGVELQKASK